MRRLVSGDKPYVVVLLAVIVFGTLMILGPLHSYLEGRDRLELLHQQDAALQQEIARLEARGADLNDPDYIELLAREQLGLVKPGEIPYVVIAPEPERPQVEPEPVEAEPEPLPARVWEALRDLFR